MRPRVGESGLVCRSVAGIAGRKTCSPPLITWHRGADMAPEPLRHREHPVAHGQPRQDPVGEVRGHLRHASRVARGADAAALAAEGDQALVAAVTAPGSDENVGRDAAPHTGPEVVLDPGRTPPAGRVVVLGRCEERLQVVLHDGAERPRRRASRPVDGSGGPRPRLDRMPSIARSDPPPGALGGGAGHARAGAPSPNGATGDEALLPCSVPPPSPSFGDPPIRTRSPIP